LASSSSTNSHSFYPSQNDIKTKQTRSTLRTVNTSAELNLPLGKNNSLVLTFRFISICVTKHSFLSLYRYFFVL
jgi:hypothetical protein